MSSCYITPPFHSRPCLILLSIWEKGGRQHLFFYSSEFSQLAQTVGVPEDLEDTSGKMSNKSFIFFLGVSSG